MEFIDLYLPLILLMIATGLLGGVMAGLMGIGGGIVIVPVLEFALGLLKVDPVIRMHVAVATSLATIIPTSLSSARAHHLRGAVDLGLVKKWGGWIFFGAAGGAGIAAQVDSGVLSAVFAGVALFVAAKMILPLSEIRLGDRPPGGIATPLLPTVIGGISTMMGIGGGALSVTIMTFFSVPIHRAVGTASLFGLFIALPGTIGFMVTGYFIADSESLPPGSIGFVNAIGFLIISPATYLAAPLGARLAHSLTQPQLRTIFGGFLLLAACRMLYRGIIAG